jgi:hypothetical protein
MSYRVRYIFDFANEVVMIQENLQKRYAFNGQNPRPWVIGAIRSLLVQEFFLNALPDSNIPYFPRDAFNLRVQLPRMVELMHRRFPSECKFSTDWVQIRLDPQDDLFLEFDYRPIDFSSYWDKPIHAPDLPPQRPRS